MSFVDIVWFSAELAAYAGLIWWAVTRRIATRWRIVLAAVTLALFAGMWGAFASPTAAAPLTGPSAVAFKAAWFCVAALAGGCAVRTRRTP